MVLESLLNPKKAEAKPSHVFFIAILYTVVAIFFARAMFPSQSSMLTVMLITLIFVPFFQKLFNIEESKECLAAENRLSGNLFQRHSQIILVFSAFFLGIIVAMSFIFFFLPMEDVFQLQSDTLKAFSGRATGGGDFMLYLTNNTQVMILIFVLSAIMGAGAIFILTWNASVIAVYLGLIVQSLSGKLGAAAYLFGVPIGLGSIALHGIPEIAAYFIAGVAGGILSVGLIRERFMSKEFKLVFKDSLIFLFFAESLIIGAAFIESLL